MKFVKYDVYKDPNTPRSGEYLETAVDFSGFAHIFTVEKGVEIIGRVKSGYSMLFLEEIKKKHPDIHSSDIHPIADNEKKEFEKLESQVKQILENAIETEG